MKELAERALDTASALGARYTDVRIERREAQSIAVKNGRVDALSDDVSQGFGVRVVCEDAWGFASSSLLEPAEVDRVVALAMETARASATTRLRPVRLGESMRSRGVYRTPVRRERGNDTRHHSGTSDSSPYPLRRASSAHRPASHLR